MPELTWVGKDKVITHHLDVPYRVLDRQYSYDEHGQHAEDNGSGNMIIHGDNLEALKALLPRYEGKVDAIYIDPPYNTGNEGWIYNDNVNDPRIKKWLGEVVGKEGEDLSRHDKWLCMMYPRLRLLQKLLSEDGSLIVSLSHHELGNFIPMLKEIFAARQVMVVPVQASGGKPSNGFTLMHEYLIYVTPKDFEPSRVAFAGGKHRQPHEALTLSTFSKEQRPGQVYPIFIEKSSGLIRGVGESLSSLVDSGKYCGTLENYFYDCQVPAGCDAVWPVTNKGKECVWRLHPQRLMSDWQEGFIKVTPNSRGRSGNKWCVNYLPKGVIEKIRSGELQVVGKQEPSPTLVFGDNQTEGTQVPSLWLEKGFFTVNGTRSLEDIFSDSSKSFTYPKPVRLVTEAIRSVTSPNSLVLDSFAGSGTTGEAVLSLNAEDGGHRRFILIELGEYADDVTAVRVKRVISGYSTTKSINTVVFEQKLTASSLKRGSELFEEAQLAASEAAHQYDKVQGPTVKEGFLRVSGTTNANSSIPGLGGSLSYYELGEPLLVEGNLNPAVPVERVREYIWFTETHTPYTPGSDAVHPHFLGNAQDVSYFFAFDPERSTVLDREYLATIPLECKAESYLVYADVCVLSDQELAAYNMTFKKIPRDITRL